MVNQPRDPEALTEIDQRMATTYTFEPSASVVLGYLMPAYIRTIVLHALLDSAAAEHGARRRAMQSATENAKEVITALSRTYNRERQGSITTELNEIIAGASALEDK
jgi:F-type H+-transporting ATPase subunit gamma